MYMVQLSRSCQRGMALSPARRQRGPRAHQPYMTEWMYSEPPGADPRTFETLTGHIGHSWTGAGRSWTGVSYRYQNIHMIRSMYSDAAKVSMSR